jgi:Uncharacterized conserved protein
MDIVVLGSGNVATHFGKALSDAGHRVVQVYSRTKANAKILASAVKADAIDKLAELDLDADVYLIAVKDDAIGQVVTQLPSSLEGAVVHTAGSVDMEIFAAHVKRYGVMYPVQTFSIAKPVDFSMVPIALEASDEATYTELVRLAGSVSKRCFFCDSRQRLALHIAAVFACNFTNHFYAIGADILGEYSLDFDLIRPLILETAQKIMAHQPREVQTGPAIRNDIGTMQKHLKLLEQSHQDLVSLYRQMSERIYSN